MKAAATGGQKRAHDVSAVRRRFLVNVFAGVKVEIVQPPMGPEFQDAWRADFIDRPGNDGAVVGPLVDQLP
jgi:hypothetical protein